MAEKLDIEETNRIRLSLDMQPLPVPGSNNTNGPAFKPTTDSSDSEAEDPASTLETRQAAASDNWQKLQDEAKTKQDREASRLKIRKARDAAQRFAKLEGKGLGEADNAEIDTKTWLLSSKKREKKIARQRAKALEQELRERENQAQYTEADLAGVQVGHEAGIFEEEAGEQILTLKDAAVDDDDAADELENINLREKEKLEDRLKLKRKRPDYDPMDDNEEKNGVLSKYDEEIQGKEKKNFTLGQMGKESRIAKDEDERNGAGRMRFSLDYAAPTQTASDYVDPSTIKIKKPKKKKDKSKRRRREDPDEEDIFPESNGAAEAGGSNAMDIDEPVSKPRDADRFDDEDDDLQARLAASRKQALKKRKDRAAELARQIREENSVPAESTPVEEGGLVLDETTEFVAGLQRPKAADEEKPSFRKKTSTGKPEEANSSADEDADGDVVMDQKSPELKADSEDSRPVSREAPNDTKTGTGLDAEESVDTSLGATLNLLRRRNLIKDNYDGSDLNASLIHSQRFISDLHKREADAERKARLNRERDRASGKLSHLSRKEQEDYAQKENKQRDFMESRQLADVFNEKYKPNVELKYIDEHGRNMGQKEAFRELSHMFHGKMPGKQKVEKKLKKIEGERKKEAASLVDSGGSKGDEGKSATERKGKGAGVRLQ